MFFAAIFIGVGELLFKKPPDKFYEVVPNVFVHEGRHQDEAPDLTEVKEWVDQITLEVLLT